MTGQSGGEAGRAAGIGARLRSARERGGLTIEQAAQRLHVASAILQALEAEDFGSLGAPIYVKSYLGRYAELVGESTEALQQLLSSAVVIPEPDLTRIPHVRTGNSRAVGPAATLAAWVVVALVVVASLWWGLSRWRARQLVLRASQPALEAIASRSGATPATRPAHPGPRAVAAIAWPVSGKGPVVAPARSPPAGSVRITLRFAAASWVEVDDATGRHLYRALAPAAAVRTLRGTAPLHVLLGYAPGVGLAVNGRETPISAYVQSDHAASFVITADGRVLSGPRAGGE